MKHTNWHQFNRRYVCWQTVALRRFVQNHCSDRNYILQQHGLRCPSSEEAGLNTLDMEREMIRHPLFRNESNINRPAQVQAAILPLATNDEEMLQKASRSNALWTRMNLAMHLSCQQSKPSIKR